MRNWIFVVTTHRLDGDVLEGEEILRQRSADKFWGLGESTPNRRTVEAGDRVVFYIGVPQKEFAASAVLESACIEPSEGERQALSHGKKFYRSQYGVRLKEINVWQERRPAADLVPHLSFVKNQQFWGTYLQGGIRQIDDGDFALILGHRGVALPPPVSLESDSQFALESHLEDFLDRNWGQIDFGARLARYRTEEQDGRQFPAGQWSIDFLCIDDSTNELVVVELKRGKSSDSAVGQLLRYMSWVKENLAKPGQSVRGVIIAQEVDDALRYAVRELHNVAVMTYRVDFQLQRS